MNQRIMRPVLYKKQKSEETSPQSPKRATKLNEHIKGQDYTAQASYQKNKDDKQKILMSDQLGRRAALSNHSPEKIKIKVSGLIMETVTTSV